MSLVEQSINTLFGGVSRQPANVRRPDQVEAADNAMFSVVTGGWEKRPNTENIGELSGVDLTADYFVHWINRSPTEQDVILITDGSILAYDSITGASKTVTINDTRHVFLVDADGINVTGVVEVDGVDFVKEMRFDSGETTFDWSYTLSDAATVFKVEGSVDGSVWNDIATGKTGASGSFSTTIGAAATGDHNFIRFNITTGAGTAADTITISAIFKDLTYLANVAKEDVAAVSVADVTLITNRTIPTRMMPAASGTLTGTKQTFATLPAAAGTGNVWKVQGTDADNFAGFYVIDDTATSTWIETVDPTIPVEIDESTMPHSLIRNIDGTYSYGSTTWNDRASGDELTNPDPGFIGSAITDVSFFRNRLCFTADETIYAGQAGDTFNMWKDGALAVLDSDPIERSSSTSFIAILNWMTVFRKQMFATAGNAQFELSADLGKFSPGEAVFDLATSYEASPKAKPKTMGDVLYFATDDLVESVIYEYYFDDSTVSNTAANINKHVPRYIPAEVLQIATDVVSGTVYFLTSGESNSLYVYRTFFDGTEKKQSSWARWTFGADETEAYIHGFDVLSNFLVLVIERPDGIFLEQMPVAREAPDVDLGFAPLIDQRDIITGSYDSGTDLTTFTFPYEHDDVGIIILGGDFPEPGQELALLYPTSTTATAEGDWTAGPVYCGKNYEMDVELSQQFLRDDNGAILNGRLQLRDMTLSYQESGYFTVEVTPDNRNTNTWEFNGRVLDDGDNLVGSVAIDDLGDFTFGIRTNAETVSVHIKNNQPVPSVITAMAWRGEFTEVTRQG